jgi:hypothetical protein
VALLQALLTEAIMTPTGPARISELARDPRMPRWPCPLAGSIAPVAERLHTLLEVCGLFGMLIVDEDATYDPRSLNDRLLLGRADAAGGGWRGDGAGLRLTHRQLARDGRSPGRRIG